MQWGADRLYAQLDTVVYSVVDIKGMLYDQLKELLPEFDIMSHEKVRSEPYPVAVLNNKETGVWLCFRMNPHTLKIERVFLC